MPDVPHLSVHPGAGAVVSHILPFPLPMKLVTYTIETTYEQTFTICWLAEDTMTREDIAADILDAVEGSPGYYLALEPEEKRLTPSGAVAALLDGQSVFRDYHDGEDAEWGSDLRITSIEESEVVVLRKFGLV